MNTRVLPASDAAIREAAARIRSGELVAFPTETVYGLAADAENSAAIWTLFEVKQREREKAFSILVTGMDMVERYCENIPRWPMPWPRSIGPAR